MTHDTASWLLCAVSKLDLSICASVTLAREIYSQSVLLHLASPWVFEVDASGLDFIGRQEFDQIQNKLIVEFIVDILSKK